jgi:hypothetical protein
MRARWLATTVASVVLLTACGGSDESATWTSVRATTLTPGDAVPAPDPDDTVLTIAGGTAANGTSGLELDRETIEQLGLVEATIYEPFVAEDVTFRGVPLQSVISLAGPSDSASTMHSVALNDYAVDIPTTVLDHEGVLLATSANGEPIPVDEGGPIRVVFTDSHPDHTDEAYWIWSVSTIDLE